MLQRWLAAMAATFCLAVLGTAPASANYISTANVTADCTNYTVAVTGIDLIKGDNYVVKWWFGLQNPDGSITNYNSKFPVRALDKQGDFNKSKTYNWNPPLGSGTYTFAWGHATLYDESTNHKKRNTVYINFNPTQFTCTGICQCNTQNAQGFNGTGIPGGSYIWFNANFTASGTPEARRPTDGTTLYFTNGTITFTAGGTQYTIPVPNSQVTYSSSATCATTTFDTATNQWLTTVPVGGDDEIMMQDVAWQVPSNFGQVTGKVTWNATMSTNTTGVSVKWKWGAAVYSQFSTDYNALMVKPTHNNSCSFNNGDHAGTPEGEDSSGESWKDFVIGGGTGGGGANFTGSWSGTVNANITCPIRH